MSEEFSLDTALEEAYDSISEENEPPSESGRVRDEHGRFSSASPEEPAVSTDVADETNEPETLGDVQSEPGNEPAGNAPAPTEWKPASWKAEELNGWESLPPHVRAAVERRETEINRGLQEAAAERQIARTIQQIASPYEQHLRAVGTDPVGAFKESLHVFTQLQTGTPDQRAAIVRSIAQRYGVQLGDETGAAQQATDPVLTATQQQLAALQQQVTRWETTQQQAEQQQAISSVESFGKDPSRPHFQAVRVAMSDLIQSGVAKDLQEAYDKAVWLVPDVRAKIIADMETKRQAEAAKRASEARKASAVNVTARGSIAAQAPKAKNWEDDLSRQYDAIVARQ